MLQILPASFCKISHCTFSICILYQCGAAHLDATYMENNPDVSVVENDDDTWIRIGNHNSDPKLKPSKTDHFMYVGKPSNDDFTIGYEGCWDTTGITVMDNFIEVHFVTTNGDTISSGKNVGKGRTICVEPTCGSVSPTPSPSVSSNTPPSANPTKSCIEKWGSCEKDGSLSCCDGTTCTQVGESEFKCLDNCCACPPEELNSTFLRGLISDAPHKKL